MNFENKVVIVTGGGTGIGRAIATLFASHGANVMISGRRQEMLEQVCSENPEHIAYFQGDLTDAETRKQLIQETVDRFGKLDILVNNAARLHIHPFEMSTDEEFTEAFNLNLLAPVSLIREAIPHLKETKGSVVNISAAVARGVLEGISAFAMTKAGLNHMTRYIAKELGKYGIRVNNVSPGLTESEMSDPVKAIAGDKIVGWTPLGRMGRPEDIARMVLLVSSDYAAWTTGQVIGASGGLMKF